MVILAVLGLSTGVARRFGAPTFWSSYMLDIAGPAWNYILFRGLYTSKKRADLWRYFTPETTGGLIIGICFAIEAAQYFGLYAAHFDPYDLLAYSSGVSILYVIDRRTASSPRPGPAPGGGG